MDIEEMAQERNNKYLDRHGIPNWHLLNLVQETREELADAYNYILHSDHPSRVTVMQLLSDAWIMLEED